MVSDLQAKLASNEKRLSDLKQLSLQLDQKCKLPCKDTVTIQPITGKGGNNTTAVCSALNMDTITAYTTLQHSTSAVCFSDCQDVANRGGKVSGLYYIQPAKAPTPFLVYCEIDSFGRGWTVLQRVTTQHTAPSSSC